MRLFPEGDIVSIHTVYCGVFWTFLCVDKTGGYKCSPDDEMGFGRAGFGFGQVFCVLWSLLWMERCEWVSAQFSVVGRLVM